MKNSRLMNPALEIWLNQNVSMYLVRFYCDHFPDSMSKPIAEHVYKPTGMLFYQKGKSILYHYQYEQTRKVSGRNL